jgi:hypothetical protein
LGERPEFARFAREFGVRGPTHRLRLAAMPPTRFARAKAARIDLSPQGGRGDLSGTGTRSKITAQLGTGMRKGPEAGTYGAHLLHIALAVLVLAGMLLGLLEWIGQITGATVLPARMAAAQARNPNLVTLLPDIRHWAALKLPRIAHEQPEIVMIGTSRLNQVRRTMFRPYSFYNASLTAWTLDQIRTMLDHVTKVAKPRVVIIGLDYFMFIDGYTRGFPSQRNMYYDNDLRIKYQLEVNLIRSLYTYSDLWLRLADIMRGHTQMGRDGMELLGLEAMRAQAGFRGDGSFVNQGGNEMLAAQRTADRTTMMDNFYPPGGAGIDAAQLAALETLAALGHERGVTLVAVQFPMLKSVVDYLDHEPSYRARAGAWREFQNARMLERFEKLGIAFFDLSRIAENGDPRNFIDPAHTTESGTLAGIVHLLDEPRFAALFPALDEEGLRRDLREAIERGEFLHIYPNHS